jgi:hypothetical protein
MFPIVSGSIKPSLVKYSPNKTVVINFAELRNNIVLLFGAGVATAGGTLPATT